MYFSLVASPISPYHCNLTDVIVYLSLTLCINVFPEKSLQLCMQFLGEIEVRIDKELLFISMQSQKGIKWLCFLSFKCQHLLQLQSTCYPLLITSFLLNWHSNIQLEFHRITTKCDVIQEIWFQIMLSASSFSFYTFCRNYKQTTLATFFCCCCFCFYTHQYCLIEMWPFT